MKHPFTKRPKIKELRFIIFTLAWIETSKQSSAWNLHAQRITTYLKIINKNTEVLKKYFAHCIDKNENFDIEISSRNSPKTRFVAV